MHEVLNNVKKKLEVCRFEDKFEDNKKKETSKFCECY